MTTDIIAKLIAHAETFLDPDDWEVRLNSEVVCLEGRCLTPRTFNAATADAKFTFDSVLDLGYVPTATCRLGAVRDEDRVAEAGVEGKISDEVWHGSIELVLRKPGE